MTPSWPALRGITPRSSSTQADLRIADPAVTASPAQSAAISTRPGSRPLPVHGGIRPQLPGRSLRSAQAMTVLPDPGGATSTPVSWRASSSAASCWAVVKVAVKANSCPVPAERSSVTSRRLPASSASAVTAPIRPRGSSEPPRLRQWPVGHTRPGTAAGRTRGSARHAVNTQPNGRESCRRDGWMSGTGTVAQRCPALR